MSRQRLWGFEHATAKKEKCTAIRMQPTFDFLLLSESRCEMQPLIGCRLTVCGLHVYLNQTRTIGN